MADVTTVVDGNVKFREGKKWKTRWCVLKKSSPVADHLQLVLYKDVSDACKPGAKPKSIFTLDSFFGLEAEICVDREQHVLAIICLKNVFLMAFELRESMIRFEIKIRQSLGEEHQFPVKVVKAPSSIKLPKDQICLMIHDTRFCFTAQTPPKILLSWNIQDLRRFVARDDKFIFEGGARCGKGSGLFAVQSDQADDIADVINLASLGKMSNSHHKFKNRSSQIELGSHLISPLPSQSSSSQPHEYFNHHSQFRLQNHVSKTPFHGAPPVTLTCCVENQTGSAESEDWSWYKRHSVSVTDHRRISSSRDKDGGQIAMGIYDRKPQSHHQELLACKSPVQNYDYPPTWHNYDHPPTLSSSQRPFISLPTDNRTVSNSYDCTNVIEGLNGTEAKSAQQSYKDEHLNETKDIPSNSLGSQGDNLENGMVAKSHSSNYDETMKRFKKQESDLQNEMILLDEMLKSCTTENMLLGSVEDSQNELLKVTSSEDTFPLNSQSTATRCVLDERKRDANFGVYDELPMTQESKDNSSLDSLSIKDTVPFISHQDIEIISGNVSKIKPSISSQIRDGEKNAKSISARLNSSLPEGTTLSPLFHAKLNSIPLNSRLNAPLPYVNLSGYDDEATNHIHLPGSADRCLPVTRGSSFQGLDKSGFWDGEKPTSLKSHTSSLTSLHVPAAMSSLTNLHQRDIPHKRSQGRQSLESGLRPRNKLAHFKLKQAIEGPSFVNANSYSQHETLVVNMDPGTVASENSLSLSKKSLFDDSSDGSKFDLVNLLTVDNVKENVQCEVKKEEIYENLPTVKEDIPPPLPPKGPALLKKLSSMSRRKSKPISTITLSPSTQLRQNKSFINSHFSHDNLPTPIPSSTHSHRNKPDEASSNYLEMGSPNTSHKFAKEDSKSKESRTSAHVKRARDDYMDMGVIDLQGCELSGIDMPACELSGDEIYLDVDETRKQSKYYVPDKEFALTRDVKVLPLNISEKRESTYVEMATARAKKNIVLHNPKPHNVQPYVCQKTESERISQGNQAASVAPSTCHSPPPRSFRIRCNSDGEPSKKANVSLASFSPGKPGKKSQMKIYSKMKGPESVPLNPHTDPPAPFTNLMEFTKRMGDSRSTYVNTVINADDILVANEFIPLPEPAKEGFLARLKRRSSKDKGSAMSDKTGGSLKSQSSILERSLSEQASPKSARNEKMSKVKLGRHRSSSFPNRSSYQESNDDCNMYMEADQATKFSSSFSLDPSISKPLWKKDENESSSSVHDYSDDSDKPPSLKTGQSDVNSMTVLYVQQDIPQKKELYTSQSTSCLTSLSFASSKTDDEKMIEIFQKQLQNHKSFSDLMQEELHLKANANVLSKKQGRYPYPCVDEPVTSVVENGKGAVKSNVMDSYCNMNILSDGMEASSPPPLPPKNRNYQTLLSPVLESTPPLPLEKDVHKGMTFTNTFSAAFNLENEEEDSLSDQYVELKEITDGEQNFCHLNSSIHSKAGRESTPSIFSSDHKEVNPSFALYTAITLSVAQTLKCRDCTAIEQETSQKSSPVLDTHSITGERSSNSCFSSEKFDDCISPAKSVLRPRAGKEYIVLKRITMHSSSCPHPCNLQSQSSLSRVLNCELHSEHCSNHFQNNFHDPCHTNHHTHPASSCASLSLCSHLSAQLTPQRSPSISTTVGTARSHQSLIHEMDVDSNQLCTSANVKQSPLESSSTVPFSPSLSPRTPSSHRKDLESCPAVLEENNIFFPIDMTFNTSSPSPQFSHRFGVGEGYPIYVNQQFVDMHYSQNHDFGSRTVSTCSSHSISSPRHTIAQSHGRFLKESYPKSKQNSESNSLGRNVRMRSRHSESDAACSMLGKKYSKSFCLPSNRRANLSLPASVHRSHSDPKRAEKNEVQQNVSQKGIHGKEFDKFAKSSIIARRRLKHTELIGNSEDIAYDDDDHQLPSTLNMSTSEPALSLQISPVKSSGYKNIDRFNLMVAAQTPPLNVVPVSHLENIVESHTPSDLQHNSLHNGRVVISNSPPPLPLRHRLVSTPSTISPPLTPYPASSDHSDSPPPYNAPPPPDCLSDTSSSDDDQELNYIEVDMTALPSEKQQPVLPISISRRSKRARQQKKLNKLRYAEIDHTVTKALQHTGQMHAQARHSGILSKSGSSLSRMNSAPVTKCHKQFRERKPSTGSIESF